MSVERLRADIDRSRVPGAYEPGRWSVAPGNRDTAMPEAVKLRDATLRALGSLSDVPVADADRAAFVALLAGSGVPEIVTGGLGRDPDQIRGDLAIIRAENPGCVTICPFVGSVEAAERAREYGYDAVQVAVPGFGPASLIYDSSLGTPEEVTRQVVVERSTAVIERAHALGLRVAGAMMMVSYLTPDVLAETVSALVAAGADEIDLFDGPGAAGPEALADLVRATAAAGPDVAVHPHNTFGLGVACAVAAVRAGAGAVEVSVNGYCGGPGNADLAATAAAFEALYGVRTGLRLAGMTELARTAERLTGRPAARHQPITGVDAFNWGGGDWIAVEHEVDPLLHNCVEPELFGNRRRVPLTEQSGPRVLAGVLRDLGIEVAAADVPEVLDACVREARALGRLLHDDEIKALARPFRRQ
ncbi:hypothetical protein [Spongiactinospora sp. 9N601]|uniref:hypothetical protein n=1 Tax=Spongiactinospora sp. 9N601 TaxID=3375149 RepID=UPI00378781CE